MRTVTVRTVTMKTVPPRRIVTAMTVVVLGLATAACSDDANDLPAGDTVETTVAPESSGTSGSPESIDPAPDPGQPGDTTVDTGTPGGDPGTGGGGSATSTGASVAP